MDGKLMVIKLFATNYARDLITRGREIMYAKLSTTINNIEKKVHNTTIERSNIGFL
jgi:hypothetical protein